MTSPHEGGNWDAAFVTVSSNGPQGGPAPAPMFDTLEAWVSGWLAPMVTVEVGAGMRWCAQWWRHPMAIARLEAIWREWEKARLADDMSAWWRDHADPHLDQLMEGARGPFRQCSGQPGGHRDDLGPLPVQQAPAGWFG